MATEDQLLDWAIELQSLAQAGLFYGKDVFDLERYERIREIAAQMIARKTDLSLEVVKDLYCSDSGYQTPKMDTRSAIFQDGKILLVQEKSGLWVLPGGFCDINLTVQENAIKEVKEEAGLTVEVERMIALLDRSKHNLKKSMISAYKAFVLCRSIGGEFQENSETLASDYFSLENLPELDQRKTSYSQIAMCFEAAADENWQVLLD